jgi:hypothetical protein
MVHCKGCKIAPNTLELAFSETAKCGDEAIFSKIVNLSLSTIGSPATKDLIGKFPLQPKAIKEPISDASISVDATSNVGSLDSK